MDATKVLRSSSHNTPSPDKPIPGYKLLRRKENFSKSSLVLGCLES